MYREEKEYGLTSKTRDRKGRETGRDQQPALTIKNRYRAHPVSINLAARLNCYRRHGLMAPNGIRHKEDAVKPQILIIL